MDLDFSDLANGHYIDENTAAVSPSDDLDFSDIANGYKIDDNTVAVSPSDDLDFSDLANGHYIDDNTAAVSPSDDLDFSDQANGHNIDDNTAAVSPSNDSSPVDFDKLQQEFENLLLGDGRGQDTTTKVVDTEETSAKSVDTEEATGSLGLNRDRDHQGRQLSGDGRCLNLFIQTFFTVLAQSGANLINVCVSPSAHCDTNQNCLCILTCSWSVGLCSLISEIDKMFIRH